MMRFVRKAFARFAAREEGTATLEFVIVIPVLTTIFLASVESGFYMTRWVMMDQALDQVVRDVRMGALPGLNHAGLAAEICARVAILRDCETNLLIEMNEIDPATFALPPTPVTCINRADRIEPVLGRYDAPSQPMLVRVCMIQDPIFPTTGFGLRMKMQGQDGYAMIATSLYANEPF